MDTGLEMDVSQKPGLASWYGKDFKKKLQGFYAATTGAGFLPSIMCLLQFNNKNYMRLYTNLQF